ncbi:MAG: Transglutaminase-like superfamily protein [Pelotomaculum sp. PtaB.Bin104]|nr:MAG: Transglutaminase-like superfamily protein [Pelotomaculum sp. PtaB.Bin104]
MISFNDINIITVLIAGIFLIPILAGMLHPFSSNRIRYSLVSMLNSMVLLLGIILAVYFARLIFSDNSNIFLTSLYKFIPSIRGMLSGQDLWAYIIAILFLLLVIISILQLLTSPLYRYAIFPLSNRISSAVNSMNFIVKRLIGGVWQLPRSVFLVFAFSLLLNFYTSFNNNVFLGEYINNSAAYQLIYKNALHPLLSTSIAKQIPVLFNDSFKKTFERKLRVIEYFNGTTLDEAVKSTPEIDNTARHVVGTENNNKKKAFLLYKWISKNVKYDHNKAKALAVNHLSGVDSGSIVAYNSRKGVCFDYSSLYVSMCRAVGLKVRFVTGLSYSGTAWGDHAWNQVYYPEEKRWINVDTTFGSSGYNYFDNPDFSVDHRYDNIQGEW